MTRSEYQPGPPGNADAVRDGDRWTLVVARDLRHPPHVVWRALTDPAQLREWAPFDPDRDLGAVGELTLTMAGSEPAERMPCVVRRVEPERLLEYTWDNDVLRWELAPTPSGTRLTLRHTMQDPSWLSKVGAGWHICLDVAERFMDGEPVGRIVAGDAMEHGWPRLNEEYAARFGNVTKT